MAQRGSVDSKKISDISKGEAFIPHIRGLYLSDAWRTLPINARKLLDFLSLEHMSHAGTENGFLKAPYSHLEDYGINRRFINKAISDAEERGLLVAERGPRIARNRKYTNTYRITYFKYKEVDSKTGGIIYRPPSHEWKRYKKNSS